MIQNPPVDSAEARVVRFNTAVPDALFRSYLGSVSSVFSVSELSQITELTLDAHDLTDMAGIEYARSLTILRARNSAYTTLNVEELTGLTELLISDGSLGFIRTAPLINLVTFSAKNNLLTELDASGMDKLTLFYIYANLIEQTELEAIVDDLHTNRVALGALSCSIRLESNAGSASTATSKATEIADLIAAGCSVSI